MLLMLIAVCGAWSCEQANPEANATTGANVQVTQGDTTGGEYEDDEDDEEDDDDD